MTAKKSRPAKPAAEKKSAKDAALKRAVLDCVLPHAQSEGFTDAVLAKSGRLSGVDAGTLARLFPDGPQSIIAEFSHAADAEMEKRLAKLDLPKLKIRERIQLAVRTRIAVLEPHKEAARRAVATLTLPTHASLGAKLLYRSVDAMWRAAGDTSTDFNFYTKRGILAGVYSATLMRWFNDKSADGKATDAFLGARIENVMQFEKFKAGVKKSFAGLPSLAQMLRSARKKTG